MRIFKSSAGIPALLALVKIVVLLGLVAPNARAEEPDQLSRLMSRISDAHAGSAARHRAFLELLFDVDALARQRDEKAPVLSRCAAFSFLYSTLYQLNDRNIEATFEDAPLFIGTTPVIYGTMIHDSRMLRGPLKAIKGNLGRILTTSYNRASGDSKSAERFFADIDDEQSQGEKEYPQRWHEFQNIAVANLSGIPGTPVELPIWLTTHSGAGLETNKDPHLDRQDPRWGYLQLKGDDDATGRHDHLIGTMMLGYSAERAREDKILADEADANVCHADPTRSLPWYQADILRAMRWTGHRVKDSYNIVRPANWMYTLLRVTAPYAEEYLAPGQNSSKSDATVNSRGQRFGARLARTPGGITAAQFNDTVFHSICDESRITPEVPGPVSAESLRQELDRVAPSVKLTW